MRRGKGGEDEDGARRESLTVDALIISLCCFTGGGGGGAILTLDPVQGQATDWKRWSM